MKKLKYAVLILATLSLLISIAILLFNKTIAYPENKWTRLIEECSSVVDRARRAPVQGITNGPVNNCQAIGVFPSTVSGGLGIGGQYGQGIIMIKKGDMWSSPAIFTLAGGSFGWQIGAEATDIIAIYGQS